MSRPSTFSSAIHGLIGREGMAHKFASNRTDGEEVGVIIDETNQTGR
jgi:hypothetical protein